VIFQRSTGRILEATGGKYGIIFLVCGVAYVGAWVIFQALVPRMRRVEG